MVWYSQGCDHKRRDLIHFGGLETLKTKQYFTLVELPQTNGKDKISNCVIPQKLKGD